LNWLWFSSRRPVLVLVPLPHQVLAQLLRARVPGRRISYRTGLVGWYLRRDRSLGVDRSGAFYHLDAPMRISSLLLGVRLTPTDPPLRVGVGARDGESLPLRELLRLRLEEAG
jgi:hypothetical protein